MMLIPWRERRGMEPFRDLERIRSQMNSLFNTSLSKWLEPFGDLESKDSSWGPALEIDDKKKEVLVKLEIPGMNKEDIDVSIDEGVLTISGERKREEKKEEDGRVRSEFCYGSFERRISLSEEIDEKKVRAAYKNGVLKVALPKKEIKKTTPSKIKIEE
ncbi:MAG: Hsp20/alpha crystallin family protein [Elusimicrobia bacterium]|nr:Hsp20/alpha crystallin family protein [Elusimicrobiota bacterium]